MKSFVALLLLSGVAAADMVAIPQQEIAPGPRPPRVKPQPPSPAPDIAAHAKPRTGTWTCKGNTMNFDGSSTPLVATLTIKLDLDNLWLQAQLVSSTHKVTAYRTYDPVAKQWTQVQLDNAAGHVVSTSPGEASGAWTFTGTQTSPAGTTQVTDHEQLDGGKLKLWGEALLAGSWQKTYEVTCAH